jgi:lactoylglutathione lyase
VISSFRRAGRISRLVLTPCDSAASIAAVPARALGVNHIVLEVGDLEEALEFYGRLFELRLRGRVPGMAFLDMGDQFLVLAEGREQAPDGKRHFGLVVDDREALREALESAETEILPGRGLDFRDPWGNHVQVVEYGDVQFQKSPAVLEGMGLSHLKKSEAALRELREKGLAAD